jgi:hypothetical protein
MSCHLCNGVTIYDQDTEYICEECKQIEVDKNTYIKYKDLLKLNDGLPPENLKNKDTSEIVQLLVEHIFSMYEKAYYLAVERHSEFYTEDGKFALTKFGKYIEEGLKNE